MFNSPENDPQFFDRRINFFLITISYGPYGMIYIMAEPRLFNVKMGRYMLISSGRPQKP